MRNGSNHWVLRPTLGKVYKPNPAHTESETCLLLQYLGLCVVVDGLVSVGQVFCAVFDVNARVDHTSTTGEDQLLQVVRGEGEGGGEGGEW